MTHEKPNIEKIALVTGGSHGIGLAIAEQLANSHYVLICSRDKKRLYDAKKRIGDKCSTFVCDVLDTNHVDQTIAKIKDQFNGVDILVNNVGGGGRWGKDNVDDFDEIVWDQVYDKNLRSTVRFTLAFLPYMKKRNWGRVIAITSIYGREAGGRPWFNIAKHAQTVFIKNLSKRKELVRKGITFNSVAPGPIMIPDTGWASLQKENPDEFNRILEEHPMGRIGEVDEVASLVSFLCSDNSSWINGASIPIDGGEGACL